MHALLKWFIQDPPAKQYRAEVRQGKGGRWRWMLRGPNGRFVARSAIHGEDSAFAAKQALLALAQSRIEITQWEMDETP